MLLTLQCNCTVIYYNTSIETPSFQFSPAAASWYHRCQKLIFWARPGPAFYKTGSRETINSRESMESIFFLLNLLLFLKKFSLAPMPCLVEQPEFSSNCAPNSFYTMTNAVRLLCKQKQQGSIIDIYLRTQKLVRFRVSFQGLTAYIEIFSLKKSTAKPGRYQIPGDVFVRGVSVHAEPILW